MPRKPYIHVEPDAYIVVHDPDPIGGFPKGAELNREHVRYMLADGNFTVGTKLMNIEGQCYVVKRKCGKQELTPA